MKESTWKSGEPYELERRKEALRAALAEPQLAAAADEIEQLRETNEAFGRRQNWWSERMFDLEQEVEQLRAALAEPQPEPVPVVPREFRAALRKLVFMARTSGGTAALDSGLMATLDEAERVLALPYLNAEPQPEPAAAKTSSP